MLAFLKRVVAKWIAFSLCMMFSACNRSSIVLPDDKEDDSIVQYLTDDEGFEDGTHFFRARVAANAGKVCFEYLNNETEIFRPSTYTVRLWAVDETADPSYSYLSGLGDGKYDHPTYTVAKPNNRRSYTRKTIKAGWYLAEFDGSGKFFKFQVLAGSDGLLIYNEHDFNSSFQGYFSSYGKIKVGWKKAPNQDASTVLNFFVGSTPYTNVWIYAEDGTGAAKSQFWFMPTGSYTLDYNLYNDDRYKTQEVTVTISPGKTYPYVKMTL